MLPDNVFLHLDFLKKLYNQDSLGKEEVKNALQISQGQEQLLEEMFVDIQKHSLYKKLENYKFKDEILYTENDIQKYSFRVKVTNNFFDFLEKSGLIYRRDYEKRRIFFSNQKTKSISFTYAYDFMQKGFSPIKHLKDASEYIKKLETSEKDLYYTHSYISLRGVNDWQNEGWCADIRGCFQNKDCIVDHLWENLLKLKREKNIPLESLNDLEFDLTQITPLTESQIRRAIYIYINSGDIEGFKMEKHEDYISLSVYKSCSYYDEYNKKTRRYEHTSTMIRIKGNDASAVESTKNLLQAIKNVQEALRLQQIKETVEIFRVNENKKFKILEKNQMPNNVSDIVVNELVKCFEKSKDLSIE
jgi:hypothetical protein